jgi:opacity protein-like surface antigen
MRVLIVLLLALTSTAALAQDAVYVGIGYGIFDYKEVTNDPPFADIDEQGDAWKLFGGFDFNEHFGIEVGYGKYTGIETVAVGSTVTIPEYTAVADLEQDATTLKALGYLPLDRIVLIGGLGFFSVQADYDRVLSAPCCGTLSDSFKYSENGLTAMLGVEWRFGRFGTEIAVRLEYEQWNISGVDKAATTGVALSYRF